MLIRQPRPGDTANIRPSEITPESVYLDRRRLLQAALAAGVAGLGGAWSEPARAGLAPLDFKRNEKYSTTEAPNRYEDITSNTNSNEFGRSEEHTSDPQSPVNLVSVLLLEKK